MTGDLLGPIWGEKLPPNTGLTWWGKFWKSMVPLMEGTPWKKLSSAALVVPVDQVLPNEDGGREVSGGPVSWGGCWWKLSPGRTRDSMETPSAEAARLLSVDRLSGSDEEGSDDGVGVEGGGSAWAGSSCWWSWALFLSISKSSCMVC